MQVLLEAGKLFSPQAPEEFSLVDTCFNHCLQKREKAPAVLSNTCVDFQGKFQPDPVKSLRLKGRKEKTLMSPYMSVIPEFWIFSHIANSRSP